MFRGFLLTLLGVLLVQITPAPAAAQGACPLCNIDPKDRKCFRGDGTLKPNRKGCEKFYDAEINLAIESDIDFGRLVMIGSGAGSVVISLDGTKAVSGNLDDLGGIAMNGKAVVTGMPFRTIRVDMPSRVTMRDPAGGTAEIREFATDLPALAVLDADGRLEFTFTGTLYTGDEITVGGNLRGRVPIRVDYD